MTNLSMSSTATLPDGSKIPLLGIGTYLCSNEEAKISVAYALSIGYRHIDTAEFYNNHEGVAQGIKESNIDRKDIFITDKLNPGSVFGAPAKTYELPLNL